jgi:hypothetical protein
MLRHSFCKHFIKIDFFQLPNCLNSPAMDLINPKLIRLNSSRFSDVSVLSQAGSQASYFAFSSACIRQGTLLPADKKALK